MKIVFTGPGEVRSIEMATGKCTDCKHIKLIDIGDLKTKYPGMYNCYHCTRIAQPNNGPMVMYGIREGDHIGVGAFGEFRDETVWFMPPAGFGCILFEAKDISDGSTIS